MIDLKVNKGDKLNLVQLFNGKTVEMKIEIMSSGKKQTKFRPINGFREQIICTELINLYRTRDIPENYDIILCTNEELTQAKELVRR